jgi:hypothetical protein
MIGAAGLASVPAMTITSSSTHPGVPVALSDAARRHPRVTRVLTGAHAAVLAAPADPWVLAGSAPRSRCWGRPDAAPAGGARRRWSTLPDGDDLVVVAANAGAERPPAWWLDPRAADEGVAIEGAASAGG